MPQQLLIEKVLTADEQKALTPDEVIFSLKEGNQRYISGNLTMRDHSKLIRDASIGQYPKAIVLSCVDSRVPVEDVFDKGIGDMFIARIAGNIVNNDILGSMEFSCKVSGAKLVLVLGHGSCGAVKGAIDNVELGNLTKLLKKISPAVDKCSHYEGEKSSKNADFVDMVIRENVRLTVNDIRAQSPILNEMELNNEIKIIGAYYSMIDGKVTFFDEFENYSS